MLCFDDDSGAMPCDVSWVPSRPGYREGCIQLERPGHVLCGQTLYYVCILGTFTALCIYLFVFYFVFLIYVFIYLYYFGCVSLGFSLDAN